MTAQRTVPTGDEEENRFVDRPDVEDLARTAARAAGDKLATDVVALDVREHFPLADAFVLASASTERQVMAVVDEIEDRMREHGAKPLRREGERDGRWVLIDFGDVVVHVQHEEERAFYRLENLWKDCPPIALETDEEPEPAR